MSKHNLFLTIVYSFLLIQCNPEKQEWDEYTEIKNLIQLTQLTPQFENYKVDFKAEKKAFEFTGAHGNYIDSIWVITDHGKYVSLYFEQDKPYLDVFAHNPYTAPTKLEMPVRHHNATLLGTRLTTSVWYDKWAISGDIHDVKISEGGATLTIIESQKWTEEGHYKRIGESEYRMIFSVDPYFGYMVEMNCSMVSNDSLNNYVEFINFMPPDVVYPWPGQNQFPYTIYSSMDSNQYAGYANNLYAGNLSDEEKTDWGKGFEIRNGGLISMVDTNSWSPALFRSGDLRFVQRTCDAWLDQHNHVLLPTRGDDGFFRMNPKFVFVYLPPEISNYLIDHMKLEQFNDKKATMIRLGVLEGFENQPLSSTDVTIGLTKGFWQKDFEISTEESYSGHKSLLIHGKPSKQLLQPQENFIRYPQVPLAANAEYKLSAWVKSSSPNVKAWISADTYEWTPYDKARLTLNATNIGNNTDWEEIQLTITTPDFDPFIDFRFMVEGVGDAWFDDFQFSRIN